MFHQKSTKFLFPPPPQPHISFSPSLTCKPSGLSYIIGKRSVPCRGLGQDGHIIQGVREEVENGVSGEVLGTFPTRGLSRCRERYLHTDRGHKAVTLSDKLTNGQTDDMRLT